MEYVQISIPCLDGKKDIVIAELTTIGYSGFWEEGQLINAYIDKAIFVEKELYNLLGNYSMENNYSISNLEEKNWNSEWESNFQPVSIENKVHIRADFHDRKSEFEYEITINPQMSFGTGHHETTALMVQLMLKINFKEANVLDMGSGTGILAILAVKLGAKHAIAIENDPGSAINCKENITSNKCANIEVIEGSIEASPTKSYDVVLSNITKNINKSILPKCVKLTKQKGLLLISGFLNFDEDEMRTYCESLSCRHIKTIEKNRWQAMLFERL
jgi:ribosomal protein L11 methyltransferase